MKRFLAMGGLLCLAWATSWGGPAAAGVDPADETRAVHRKAARPGAFCTAWRCRPRAASPLTGAAFGAVVIAIGWRARRRAPTEA